MSVLSKNSFISSSSSDDFPEDEETDRPRRLSAAAAPPPPPAPPAGGRSAGDLPRDFPRRSLPAAAPRLRLRLRFFFSSALGFLRSFRRSSSESSSLDDPARFFRPIAAWDWARRCQEPCAGA